MLLWPRWGGIRKGIWIDLDVYIRGALAVMRDEPLYAVSVQGQPFTYPPFAALIFVPLELLGSIGARWLLTAASVGCYLLVIVLCARRLRMKPMTAALVGLAGLAFEPFARNVLLGQINILLVAMVILDCLVVPARYRGMLIGIAAGKARARRVHPLPRHQTGVGRRLALRCRLCRHRWTGGRVCSPRDSWQFWTGGFINLPRVGADAAIRGDNQSLTGVFMRLSHDVSPPTMVTLLLSAGAMALGVVAAKRQVDAGNDVAALVCIALASLLASPISWTHHWIWAVIALLVLVQGRRRVAAAVFGAIFVIGPMWFTHVESCSN